MFLPSWESRHAALRLTETMKMAAG